MIRTIALNRLMPSPRNVRRASDHQADQQLQADIAARGLLQNLVVAPSRKPKGSFTVEAGGRRLRALKALAEEGALPEGHEVCCLVIDGGPGAAQEAGLAENFQRLAMNPADECLAFKKLIEEGADIEGVARRFGLSARFVEGRLRLATLAPAVFEALGAGEITLDVAKAYAASSDAERQSYVFEQLNGSYAGNNPDSIRRMMTEASASSGDRRARFVGEEAYVAAGGQIERDLFSEGSGERWLDIALLERLAAEKIEAVAAVMASETGLGWVRPTLDPFIGYGLTQGLRRVVPEREPLTGEERARIEAAEADIEQLGLLLEDEGSTQEACEAAEARIADLQQEVEAIADKPVLIDDAFKARLGAFLILDPDGRAKLDSVYYAEPEPEAERDACDGPKGGAGGGSGEIVPAVQPADADQPAEGPIPIPRSLIDELAIQRRDILAVHIAADPALALDLATFLMADRAAGYGCERSGSSLQAPAPTDPVAGFETREAKATVARAQAVEALDRSWTGRDTKAERFDAFRSLPDAARAAWLGHSVARSLESSADAPGERACAFHDHLGRLTGIEVARWWRPTGANFFDRVPKAAILSALEAVGGPAFAARYAKAKKAELAQSAERIFAGEIIAEAEVKARALAWLPEPMRFAPAPVPAAANDDDTPPWEIAPTDPSAEAAPAADQESSVEEDRPQTSAEELCQSAASNADEESGAGTESADPAQHEEMEEAA